MSIQFNVCPLNHVSILREMFTDRMKSNGDAVSQLHIGLLHQTLTPLLDMFFFLGAVHNTLIATSSRSTDLATQNFFGFMPM